MVYKKCWYKHSVKFHVSTVICFRVTSKTKTNFGLNFPALLKTTGNFKLLPTTKLIFPPENISNFKSKHYFGY